MSPSWTDSFGATVCGDGVRFVVQAPKRAAVTLVLESEQRSVVMERGEHGQFSVFVPNLGAGARYRYRLDEDTKLYPDPASRFQPEGPHGPSEVVDAKRYQFRDDAHPGVQLAGQVIYELHVGTFTQEGTFQSATRELRALAELGITLLELMPVAEFPGRFGWGYDGVHLFAPSHLYGTPDDLRALVDEAHALGMGVILDVVYNHLGPDGNYMAQFTDTFFSSKSTEWGACINFDEPGSELVRAFYCANAAYWAEEFHMDGLRLDATQDIHDSSPTHVLIEVSQAMRAAAGKRSILIVGENEPQHTSLLRSKGPLPAACDALWNDDFHHAAHSAATGRNEAYYSDTPGSPQELISALKWGYLYQGQYYAWQKKLRGQPGLDLPAKQFVTYLQNHDQIANSQRGLRLHQLASPGRTRALKALMLLGPGTPMLFQGEEVDADQPFLYFADHHQQLSPLVRNGRSEFLAQFPSLSGSEARNSFRDPKALETFTSCKIDWHQRETHKDALALTRDLLQLRKGDSVFSTQRNDRLHGAVLGSEAFALRYLGEHGDDRLILVNLGRDRALVHAPEPLLAPPFGGAWNIMFSTEDLKYGGTGTPPLSAYPHLFILGHSALVLTSGSPRSSLVERP